MLMYSPRLIYNPKMRSQSLRHATNNIAAEDETNVIACVSLLFLIVIDVCIFTATHSILLCVYGI